jgi:hypothetical protein
MKRTGLLLIGLLITASMAFAVDFKEVKKAFKTSVEMSQVETPVVLATADVLIQNATTIAIGELNIVAVNAKKIYMFDLYPGYKVQHRTNLKGTDISYSVVIQSRRLEPGRRYC